MSDLRKRYDQAVQRAGRPICNALAMTFGSVDGSFESVPPENRERFVASLAGIKTKIPEAMVSAGLNPRAHGLAFATPLEEPARNRSPGEDIFRAIRADSFKTAAADDAEEPLPQTLEEIHAQAWSKWNRKVR